jgi:hypothetical protein
VSISTPTGPVYYGGVCRDDYPNIRISTFYVGPKGRHITRPAPIKLQLPALLSLQAVEEHLGVQIHVTGTWRSCSYQTELYRSDPSRYAPPDVTAHCRGLAIDVATTDPNFAAITRTLAAHGWHRVRPTDEPWHNSYGVDV